MTCVIGLIDKGVVYLAADSAIGTAWEIHRFAQPKVFRLGEMLIGVSGYPRVTQIIRYAAEIAPQAEGQDDMTYMVNVFCEAVRKALKDRGAVEIENEVERIHDSIMLVGYRGHLYEIDMNFQVVEYQEPYAAIGSGEAYALGVLYALKHLDPKDRIMAALYTAAHFTPTVCGPFVVERL